MKNTTLKHGKVLLAAILLTVCGFGMSTAHAASGGLTISPTSINQEIAPGATYKDKVLVINQGEADFNYKVYATPYSVDGEAYKPYFTPVKGATDITSWFTFEKTGSQLKIGSQDTIPFAINVPKNTGAGSYYATIFAETEDKGSSGVITRKRVGTVVYIRVSGTATEKGSIDAWSVPWLQKAPFTAHVKLANTGSVHYEAKVKVKVSDIFGGSKFEFERDPKVLPQKLRSLPVTWDKGATFGLFKVGGEVSYLGKTEKLATKYVFIASTPMRIVTAGLLLVFIAGVIFLGRKRVAHK